MFVIVVIKTGTITILFVKNSSEKKLIDSKEGLVSQPASVISLVNIFPKQTVDLNNKDKSQSNIW